MANKKNQTPGADLEETAPGAASENENDQADEKGNFSDGNSTTDATEETGKQESGSESQQESGDDTDKNKESKQDDFNLSKYGLKSKSDLEIGIDRSNGKVSFASEEIPDGGKLKVRINGKKSLIEFTDGWAFYAKGGAFITDPSIEID